MLSSGFISLHCNLLSLAAGWLFLCNMQVTSVSFLLTMQSKIDTSMFKALILKKLPFRVSFRYQQWFKGSLCSQLLVLLLLELFLWPLSSVPTWTLLHIFHLLFSRDSGIQTTALFFLLSNREKWQRNLVGEWVTTEYFIKAHIRRSYCILSMLPWFN